MAMWHVSCYVVTLVARQAGAPSLSLPVVTDAKDDSMAESLHLLYWEYATEPAILSTNSPIDAGSLKQHHAARREEGYGYNSSECL